MFCIIKRIIFLLFTTFVCSTQFSQTVNNCSRKRSSYSYDISHPYRNETKSFKLPKNAIKILLWVPRICFECPPFHLFGRSNTVLKKNNCNFQNCYITVKNSDSQGTKLLEYKAILFHGKQMQRMESYELPKMRQTTQRYIFVQIESTDSYPICQSYYDDFFNWTMTYRLDSNITWTYFVVKNSENELIGPKIDMKWRENMTPIDVTLKLKLAGKFKLVAWFVSNCKVGSGRKEFAMTLKKELERLNETLDIYGSCGTLRCPKANNKLCHKMIEKEYMFYLAAENSLAEDYITEKVVTALQHKAIPILYGAANYSRFLPPGSFLDGRKLGPKILANLMVKIAKNPSLFYKFFNWQNHYRYEENSHGGILCQLCTRLNQDESTSQYLHFRKWWNKDYANKCAVHNI